MMPRLLALALLAGLPAASAVDGPAANLPRSSPEAQGIPSSALLAFVDAAEAKIDALHSFMVVRHGYVVAEGWWSPYQKDDPHMLFSLSKSFTSTGIGLAAAEGRLTIDDPFKFADDRLVLDREYNVALGDAPTRRPLLVGQAEGSRLGRFDADHEGRVGEIDDRTTLRGRKAGRDRLGCRTELPSGQRRLEELDAVRQTDCHERVLPHAKVAVGAREPVGARLQLCPRNSLLSACNRGTARIGLREPSDQNAEGRWGAHWPTRSSWNWTSRIFLDSSV